jgi:hypothetical protein
MLVGLRALLALPMTTGSGTLRGYLLAIVVAIEVSIRSHIPLGK